MIQFFEKEFTDQVTSISWATIVISVIILLVLQFVHAPYGRYYEYKVYFQFTAVSGRFGWFFMESPTLIIPALIAVPLLRSGGFVAPTNLVLFMMYIFHYIYRTLIYPFLQNPKPHTTLSVLSAFSYCCANGYIQGLSLLLLHEYSKEWMMQPNFIAGVVLWAVGLSTNIYADHILRNLRKPGETGYKIPTGFLFEYVSCANFMGEVLEWIGYALACWNIASLSFAVFTACNLIPRAMQHHRYYKEKFEDYPRDRKAIIPFIL